MYSLKKFELKIEKIDNLILPVKNKGILFIMQTYIKNTFSFNAKFFAIPYPGFILSIISSYSNFI